MRGKTTREGPRSTLAELVTAIEHRALNRVRPKLVTVLAIMLGLVPGGMVTSTVLTLMVIPVLYCLWRRRQCTRQEARAKMAGRSLEARAVPLRRGVVLEVITVGYNALEGLIAIVAGLAARSVALTGVGVDSVIEVTSGALLWWRLRAELGERAFCFWPSGRTS